MANSKRVLLTAGGTGGHFFPALAAAEELQKKGCQVHFSTDKRCQKYIPQSTAINFKIIDLYFRTGNKLALLLLPIKISIALLKALLYVARLRPSVVIGFGGYPSFPVLLACKILFVPIILHEQNRFLGKVNRFFARKAKLVAFSYDNSKHANYQYVGDIVREDIRNIRLTHDFSHKPIRIFIFGGSQGAKIFTQTIPAAMQMIKKANPSFNCHITHQVSSDNKQSVEELYQSLGFEYEVADFFHNMHERYQATDLVISRSGASTIAELSAVGLPAIFIPFPYAAENHQYENAKFIENIGGGWVIEENKYLSEALATKLIQLEKDRAALKTAAKNISSRKSDGLEALVATVSRIISK